MDHNVDTWCRQIEQALHQIEKYLREIAAGNTARLIPKRQNSLEVDVRFSSGVKPLRMDAWAENRHLLINKPLAQLTS